MKPNCIGCEEEFDMACYEQEVNGLHLVQSGITNLGIKGKHFFIMMVDDNGKVRIS